MNLSMWSIDDDLSENNPTVLDDTHVVSRRIVVGDCLIKLETNSGVFVLFFQHNVYSRMRKRNFYRRG